MKKNYKLILSIVTIMILAVAFAGCGNVGASASNGSSESVTTETQTTTATSEATEETETPTSASDYNIANAISEQLHNCLPNDVDYEVEQTSENCLEVILKTAQASGCGGVAGDVMSYDEGDSEYKDLPDYKEVGTKDGKVYVILHATDVQYDPNDEQQKADYEKLVDGLDSFTVQ